MENQFSNYQQKIGILVTNLGTPDSPSKKSLRKYLNQFLMDKRVVDLPRALWIPLLKLIILNIRPKKSAKLYEKIWYKDGSPLLVHSKNIIKKLEKNFKRDSNNLFISVVQSSKLTATTAGFPGVQNTRSATRARSSATSTTRGGPLCGRCAGEVLRWMWKRASSGATLRPRGMRREGKERGPMDTTSLRFPIE